jgi:methionine synthase I (cobalamin-dependent)
MLIDQLLSAGPVVTDGAWGTQLQAQGLSGGACPDQWNLTHADVVERIPRAYAAAGSQIVLTNTFRANRVSLASYGLADQVVEINRRGVEISRAGAGTHARVFASIGPSGKMLIAGEVTEQELAAAFSEQAEALAGAGADGIVIETMAELEEAELALTAARATGLPVVGANCGQGIAGYVDICRRMRAVTEKPLWIKANAGTPEVVHGEVVYQTNPEEFAAHGPALLAAGAQFIGGCCGTTPEHIAALCQKIRS